MAKTKKSSKAANLRRRWNRIRNGMRDAGPKSPVFLLTDKRIVKLSPSKYQELAAEAESLSEWTGTLVLPEHLLRSKKKRRKR
ncbi:hypothetical protein os4_37260 (plasmid) [Comamonadaceae bacterium OS-4]|nr:hypothetical protein os4_37260 [Comamonadaceae bacterium OS-4]